MKKLGLWSVILGVLTVLAAIGMAALIINFVQNTVNSERPVLSNGDIVVVETAGVQRIFHERIGFAQVTGYPFMFTDVATGAQHMSSSPNFSTTYNLGQVSGRLVAEVYLPPGSFVVEFRPLEIQDGGGIFVWNPDVLDGVAAFVIQIIALSFAFVGLLGGFVVCLIFYVLRKSRSKIV